MAGYDTTGTTLAFACYDLAKNSDVQEKLREEVEEILGKCFMYVTKSIANLPTYTRKPGYYRGTIIFEIDIMKI